MPRKTVGRRLGDRLSIKVLVVLFTAWLSHFLTKEFIDFGFLAMLMEFSRDLASYVGTTIDAMGGIAALMFFFQVYKWVKERKK